jgi:hypothetical protein
LTNTSAIPGLRCRERSANGGELSVGERTWLSDLGMDVPCGLTVAGETSCIVRQAIAAAAHPLQDKFEYYINNGVYDAFNNLLFDHATVRPRPRAPDRGRRQGEHRG